jgi:transcriptional regulator of acetoin/glycerol metabolism
LNRLVDDPLPGNLRDLQRVAWHLVARLHAGARRADAIRDALSVLDASGQSATDVPDVEALRALLPLRTPLPTRLDNLRSRWVEAALAAAEGNVSAAARLLGVKRETLKGWLPK